MADSAARFACCRATGRRNRQLCPCSRCGLRPAEGRRASLFARRCSAVTTHETTSQQTAAATAQARPSALPPRAFGFCVWRAQRVLHTGPARARPATRSQAVWSARRKAQYCTLLTHPDARSQNGPGYTLDSATRLMYIVGLAWSFPRRKTWSAPPRTSCSSSSGPTRCGASRLCASRLPNSAPQEPDLRSIDRLRNHCCLFTAGLGFAPVSAQLHTFSRRFPRTGGVAGRE